MIFTLTLQLFHQQMWIITPISCNTLSIRALSPFVRKIIYFLKTFDGEKQ